MLGVSIASSSCAASRSPDESRKAAALIDVGASKTCLNIVVDGISAKYVGHFTTSPTGWEVPNDSGILLAGTDSVVRNSTIAFGAGHGIMLTGSRNRAENNPVRDIGYSGANGAELGVSSRPAGLNVQGLWWRGPEESGWGLNVTQQGVVLFATWFTYDTDGTGMWLFQSRADKTGTNTYRGDIFRATGGEIYQDTEALKKTAASAAE